MAHRRAFQDGLQSLPSSERVTTPLLRPPMIRAIGFYADQYCNLALIHGSLQLDAPGEASSSIRD
jgi:hypothetical protein